MQVVSLCLGPAGLLLLFEDKEMTCSGKHDAGVQSGSPVPKLVLAIRAAEQEEAVERSARPSPIKLCILKSCQQTCLLTRVIDCP